ncbi:MAG: Trm112 family protein [Candidatus Hermodarchaeota archaeon]
MKPWLCDILACPIDKFFPLELFIFSFETSEEQFKEIMNVYEERDLNRITSESIIEIQEEEGILYLKDDILIERSSIDDYLKGIISTIEEVRNLHDKSPSELSKRCFNIIRTDVRTKVIKFTESNNFERLETIIPELYLVNKIKTETEISTGLLFCVKCKRWYPIIETIPQMLPDEYRNEEVEIEFLKTNKDLLDSAFFKQDLKPYNI